MKSEDESLVHLKEIVFDLEDFFDEQKMVRKLDRLIHAWGKELVEKEYLNQIPSSDEAWLKWLDMDIHWEDLKDPWEHYVVGGLNFFIMLRADIKRDFLLQPDYIRGQRLSRWLGRCRYYLTPLLKDVITRFCLCYSMILERKPIKVRYNDISS